MSVQFPDVIATIYASKSTPKIKAGDLNGMQAEIVRLWNALRRNDVHIDDDFLGTTISTSKWQISTGVSLVDDSSVSTGNGAVQLQSTTVNATPTIRTSSGIELGDRDFRLYARVRYTVANTSGVFQLQLRNNLDSIYVDIHSTNGSNWTGEAFGQPSLGGTPYTTDLGIAPSTSYQDLEIIRQSGVLSWRINGSECGTPTSIPDAWPGEIFVNCFRTTSDCTLLCDKLAFWAPRAPISGTAGGFFTGAHVEGTDIAFTPSTSLPVTWTFVTAFPAASDYNVYASVEEVSSFTGDPVPGFQIVKSAGSVQIYPNVAFTGTVHFEAR